MNNNLIKLENEHSCIFGITRSGKTYTTLHSLSRSSEGVLYFNTNHEKNSIPKNFLEANGKNTMEEIRWALNNKMKINFIPSENYEKQLITIINNFYKYGIKNVRLVIDEVHLFKKEALNAIIKVATTGLSRNIKAVFISQRGANVNNTLITQSNFFVFFQTNLESQYWQRNYGIPLEEINKRILQKGKYSYCTFNLKEIGGAYKFS